MEIKDLILLMWRNVRYIFLGLVLGMGIGVVVSLVQTPVYEASTKVFVSRTRQQSNVDMLSLSDEQLLAINLELAKSKAVLEGVTSQLGSKIDSDNIMADIIPNTLIIQITVLDNDPQRAATIANLLVQTLIQQNEKLLSVRYKAFEDSTNEQVDQIQKQINSLQTQINQINDTGIQEQLTQVNEQIEQLKTEISGLEQEIASFPSYYLTQVQIISLTEKRGQLDQLHSLLNLYQQVQINLTYIGKPIQNGTILENPRLTTLQATLDLYRQMIALLINSRESIRLAHQQSKQNVMQIVPAIPPKDPTLPMPPLYILLGGFVGFVLAAVTILIIDHMDAPLKSAGQIEELLGIPVLGSVFDGKHAKGGLVASRTPFSAEAEAFRVLGASLEIIGKEKNISTLMITNAEPADARTTIAANLAVINAQRGKQVILLDGDLKHPYLHNLFETENQKGFAELINGRLDIKSALHTVKDIKGMTLIPSGVTEKDAKEWLDAEKLAQLMLKLQQQADLVIVDSPPADIADAQILAAKMNAVLLVIQAGHTRLETAQATLRRFRLIDARVVGVVLNQRAQRPNVKKQPLSWIKMKSGKKGKGL
jgi:capsular exopolysaccharide synthesis family protein